MNHREQQYAYCPCNMRPMLSHSPFLTFPEWVPTCTLTKGIISLTDTFSGLHYPVPLLQSTIRDFVTAKVSGDVGSFQKCDDKKVPVRKILPLKERYPSSVHKLRDQSCHQAQGKQTPYREPTIRCCCAASVADDTCG